MSALQEFQILSGDLCAHLYTKDYNKEKINSLIDELNAQPYKAELFVRKQASTNFFINRDCLLHLLQHFK